MERQAATQVGSTWIEGGNLGGQYLDRGFKYMGVVSIWIVGGIKAATQVCSFCLESENTGCQQGEQHLDRKLEYRRPNSIGKNGGGILTNLINHVTNPI